MGLPPVRQADAVLGMLVAAAFGCAALVGLLGAAGVLGLKAVALFGFAVGVAWLRARGPGLAPTLGGWAVAVYPLALLMLAGAAGPAWRGPGVEDFVLYPAAACLGWLAGMGLAERWTFGRIVGVVMTPVGVLLPAAVLLRWEEWHALAAGAVRVFRQALEQSASQADPEQMAATLRALEWQVENWAHISIGVAFAMLVLGVVMALGASRVLLRVLYGLPGTSLGFRHLRPPEWLVWPVIALALAALADWHRPELHLRPVAWNGLIALGAVYWLNGVSLTWHALMTFKAHPFIVVAAVVLLAIPQLRFAVVMVGLFDTWYEFRRRFELLARLRQARRETND